jgi:hypothetical protein
MSKGNRLSKVIQKLVTLLRGLFAEAFKPFFAYSHSFAFKERVTNGVEFGFDASESLDYIEAELLQGGF